MRIVVLGFTSCFFISSCLFSLSSCLSSCTNKLVLHCPTFFVIAECVVGNYFSKYTRFGIIFLRHPLTTQTNDSLRFTLVAWNTFNCCTNKVRNCEKLFLSGSISWLNEFCQNCMLCVLLLDLPLCKHSFTPDRKWERIQSLAFPSFIFHLIWIWCTLKSHTEILVQSLTSGWSLWTCGTWVTLFSW